MAAPQNFRTAFNGFKREDVVQYIEYINAKHTEQINQLTAENELLRQKLEAAEEQPAAEPAEQEVQEGQGDLCTRLSDLDEKLAAAAARIQELEQERDAAIAERDSLSGQAMQQCRMEQELEAYRRAERAERVAKERADQLYRKASDVLGEATSRVDIVSGRVGTLADQVIAQLEELKTAVGGSKLALQETAATLYTIRPSDAEE